MDSLTETSETKTSLVAIVAPETRTDNLLKTALDKFSSGYEKHHRSVNYGLTSMLSDGIGWSKAEGKEGFTTFEQVLRLGEVGEEERALLSNFFREVEEDLGDMVDLIETPEDEEGFKLRWAQLNQRMAVAIYRNCLRSSSQAGQTNNTEIFMAALKMLSSRSLSRAAEKINIFLTGAKVQAGLMDFLETEGYLVMAPDSGSEEEIADFDLKGVDFIAIDSWGNILLIDAKGRKHRRREINVIAKCFRVDMDSQEQGVMREKIIQELEKPGGENDSRIAQALISPNLVACRVVVPTEPGFIDEFGRITGEFVKRDISKGLKELCPKG